MRAETRRPRILVVEDDPMIRDLIVTRLDLGGFETFTAVDGYDGLSRVNEVKPSALILDINMPRLDGFGMLRAMRQTGVLARTPTMVLTARNQSDDVKTAISLGARDFLAKPFRDEQLLARVARLLRKASDRPARNVVELPIRRSEILD
ncbi:MAG TPA: response regulator transcription factor [Phenylobacterium sp.]|nr:response regulator transcription factor [Phenylobacterium sp.]